MDVIGKLIASVTPKDFKNTKILLFILAIAIHNFPEGIASGLGFGTGDITNALMIAGGIALQNIPEGMVVIAPMVSVGISPRRALFYAVLTGLVEIFGTLIGYLAITVTKALLPFLLAFAAGTMLYIICGEMIPEICKENNKDNMYCLLFGFSFMLTLSVLV